MSKLTKAARGRECQVRIPGICNGNPETTVLAHYRLAGTCGTSMKPNDLQGAWACSACHDACDGRAKTEYSHDELRLMHAEGVVRTIDILVREGKVAA
ncbi:putative nuclease YbcO [compost metagenome]